jgi:hypothetical protein
MRNKLLVYICLLIQALSLIPAANASDLQPLIFGGANLGYGSKEAFLRLNKGNPLACAAAARLSGQASKQEFLFCPERNFVIALKHGKLHIGKGEIAYVFDEPGQVLIANLSDSYGDKVSYEEGNQSYKLNPGDMIICCDGRYAHPSVLEKLPVRGLRPLSGHTGHALVKGEFSIISALGCLEPLRELRGSTALQDRHICSRILKTTAVNQTVTSSHGSFVLASSHNQ